MATPKINAPKYPRIMVSAKRHIALAKEAKRENLSIAALAEKKFKSIDEALKITK